MRVIPIYIEEQAFFMYQVSDDTIEPFFDFFTELFQILP